MNNLAAITVEAAAWLTEHAHSGLPPIACLRLEQEPLSCPEVSMQLDSSDAPGSLTAWSEHLGIPVVVRRSNTEQFLDGRISTRTRGGYSLELWNHFSVPEWVDLQAATGIRFTEKPVELDAATLRAALDTSKDLAEVGGVS